MNKRTTYFHEATIEKIAVIDGCLIVEMHGQDYGITVLARGVKNIRRNDALVDAISHEADDGEVLTFDTEKETKNLIVEWNDFKRKQSWQASYEFECSSLQIETRK